MEGLIPGHHISVTVRSFEGTDAVLAFPDGRTIRWPIKELPDDIAEGAHLRLIVSTDALDGERREELVRAMLNTLLRS